MLRFSFLIIEGVVDAISGKPVCGLPVVIYKLSSLLIYCCQLLVSPSMIASILSTKSGKEGFVCRYSPELVL
jgi:hypothetical protein